MEHRAIESKTIKIEAIHWMNFIKVHKTTGFWFYPMEASLDKSSEEMKTLLLGPRPNEYLDGEN